MQAPTWSRVGGYSDFFSSGFRVTSKKATTPRPRPISVSTYSISNTTQTPSKRSSFLWRSAEAGEKTGIRSPKLHRNSNSSSSAPSSSTDKHRRRSSFIEFSTKLFDKINPGASEPRSFIQLDDTKTRRRPHIRTSSSDWPNSPIAHTSSFHPYYSNANSIDPFSSSPDSKSFFIDLSDSSSSLSVPAQTRPRQQSYISFSGSSLSSFMSFSKRERTTSIHSLPAQAYTHGHGPSRNSGSYFIPTNSDKFDHSFPEESLSIVLESPYPNGEDGDLSNIDWREFHIQLFDN